MGWPVSTLRPLSVSRGRGLWVMPIWCVMFVCWSWLFQTRVLDSTYRIFSCDAASVWLFSFACLAPPRRGGSLVSSAPWDTLFFLPLSSAPARPVYPCDTAWALFPVGGRACVGNVLHHSLWRSWGSHTPDPVVKTETCGSLFAPKMYVCRRTSGLSWGTHLACMYSCANANKRHCTDANKCHWTPQFRPAAVTECNSAISHQYMITGLCTVLESPSQERGIVYYLGRMQPLDNNG